MEECVVSERRRPAHPKYIWPTRSGRPKVASRVPKQLGRIDRDRRCSLRTRSLALRRRQGRGARARRRRTKGCQDVALARLWPRERGVATPKGHRQANDRVRSAGWQAQARQRGQVGQTNPRASRSVHHELSCRRPTGPSERAAAALLSPSYRDCIGQIGHCL